MAEEKESGTNGRTYANANGVSPSPINGSDKASRIMREFISFFSTLLLRRYNSLRYYCTLTYICSLYIVNFHGGQEQMQSVLVKDLVFLLDG